MQRYLMAVDQGTTGSRAMIVSHAGRIVASQYAEFEQLYPQPGWVEHDPEVIWEKTLGVMRVALKKAQAAPQDIVGIGITNQRETALLWDRRTLKPVYNAIVWQCRRSAAICESLKNQGFAETLRQSDKIFKPTIGDEERHRLYNGWLDAVNRVKSHK